MTDLIVYLFPRILNLIVGEYFFVALCVTVLIGAVELFFCILGIRRSRR